MLNGFLKGIMAMNAFDVDVMCTGHGWILVGDIQSFVSELLNIGKQITGGTDKKLGEISIRLKLHNLGVC